MALKSEYDEEVHQAGRGRATRPRPTTRRTNVFVTYECDVMNDAVVVWAAEADATTTDDISILIVFLSPCAPRFCSDASLSLPPSLSSYDVDSLTFSTY